MLTIWRTKILIHSSYIIQLEVIKKIYHSIDATMSEPKEGQ